MVGFYNVNVFFVFLHTRSGDRGRHISPYDNLGEKRLGRDMQNLSMFVPAPNNPDTQAVDNSARFMFS